MQTNKTDTRGGFEEITTVEDLGRYLQGLRRKWRVTQESLATKTGAITEHKISRSRISEIENAKRDRVTERELRVYLRGLKCTPRHIDQMVQVLTQCTAPPAKEPSNSPDATSPAIVGAYPGGLGGGEDDPPLPQAKPASLPRPSRCCWRRHSIALIAATALLVVALSGLGVGLSLRRESGGRPASPSSAVALLVPHSAPLIAEDASDLIKDATFPAGAPVRANQQLTTVSQGWNRLADRGDALGRDATQQLIAIMPIIRCGVERAGQRRPSTARQGHGAAVAGPGSPDARGQGVAIDPSRMNAGSGAMSSSLLGTGEQDSCADE